MKISEVEVIDHYKSFSLSELSDRFNYDETQGQLLWKEGHRNCGKPAGSVIASNGGYRYLCLGKNGKSYSLLAHRVIWAIHYGEFVPNGLFIDHIDGKTDNNRIDNLRLVTSKENARNVRPRTKKVNENYVLTAVHGIRLDKKTLEYVVSYNREKAEERFDDYDFAKYARWEWEYDNDYHVNHGVNEDISD